MLHGRHQQLYSHKFLQPRQLPRPPGGGSSTKSVASTIPTSPASSAVPISTAGSHSIAAALSKAASTLSLPATPTFTSRLVQSTVPVNWALRLIPSEFDLPQSTAMRMKALIAICPGNAKCDAKFNKIPKIGLKGLENI